MRPGASPATAGTESNCVELADGGDPTVGAHIAVRDSKNPDTGTLVFRRTALDTLISTFRGNR